MRFALSILALLGFFSSTSPLANAQGADKGAASLELRVIAHRTTYPFSKGQSESHCFVAIDVELRNTGKETLFLRTTPEPTLTLTGPRSESARKTGGLHFFVPQERNLKLAPGQIDRVRLHALSYRVGTGEYHWSWREPGEYVLDASYAITFGVSAPGRPKGKADFVAIKGAPLKLTIKEGLVVDFWREALADKNIELRRSALTNLKTMASAALPAASSMIERLREDDPDIRVKAIQALEAIGPTGKSVTQPALLKMLNDEETQVLLAAIKALSMVAPEDNSIAPALLPFLKKSDAKIRLATSNALGALRVDSRRPPSLLTPLTKGLLKAFAVEKDVEVKCSLINTLHWQRELEALHALVPHINSPERRVRLQTIYSMSHMGVFVERDAVKSERLGNPRKRAVEELIVATKDREAMPHAVHGLAGFRADAAPAVPTLLELLDHPENQSKDRIHHPRVYIVQALRDIGPGAKEAARPLALRLLGDPDWSVRVYAAQALGAIGADPKIAGPALNQALRDKMEQVRNEAGPALAKIGALDALLDGLEDADPQTRRSVLMALQGMGEKARPALPLIVKTLHQDKDMLVRRNAAYALGNLGAVAASAVTDLVRALKDDGDEVRYAAADSLGRMRLPETRSAAGPLLAMAKSDKVEKNREKACWAVLLIDTKGIEIIVPALVELTMDKNRNVAHYAIINLGQVGPAARGGIQSLQRIAESNDTLLADAAKTALGHINRR